MTIILNGKKTGAAIEENLKKEILEIKKIYNKIPGLAVILVGNDKPSQTYVNLKNKKCKEIGIYSEVHNLKENISQKEIINLIKSLNHNKKIHGILVQLPIPKHLDTSKIIEVIDPEKDVDGFHPINMGQLAIGIPKFIPCTPYGVLKLIEHYNIEVKGKNAVIIGCSNVVGKPLGLLLQFCETATCTLCHIETKNISKHTKNADIIISAVGKPNLITKDMVKKDAIVIDVGFNVIETKDKNNNLIRKVCGDVDYENVKDNCSYITPVPGGVGPMTITMLMYNTIKAFKQLI